MALSIMESRAISKRIKSNLAEINAGGVSIIQSRALSKAIKVDLALLNETAANDTLIEPVAPEIIEPTLIIEESPLEQKSDDDYINELFNFVSENIVKEVNSLNYGSEIDNAAQFFRGSSGNTFVNFLSKLARQDDRNYVSIDGKSQPLDEYLTRAFCGYLNKKVGSKKRNGTWDYDLILSYFKNPNKTQVEVISPTPIIEESPLEQKSETRTQDTNILFLQEVIAGQHDSENINDLAQKIIAAGDIVVASNDAIVAGAVDKWSSLDLSVFG